MALGFDLVLLAHEADVQHCSEVVGPDEGDDARQVVDGGVVPDAEPLLDGSRGRAAVAHHYQQPLGEVLQLRQKPGVKGDQQPKRRCEQTETDTLMLSTSEMRPTSTAPAESVRGDKRQ